jgi:hypothetical protein
MLRAAGSLPSPNLLGQDNPLGGCKSSAPGNCRTFPGVGQSLDPKNPKFDPNIVKLLTQNATNPDVTLAVLHATSDSSQFIQPPFDQSSQQFTGTRGAPNDRQQFATGVYIIDQVVASPDVIVDQGIQQGERFFVIGGTPLQPTSVGLPGAPPGR